MEIPEPSTPAYVKDVEAAAERALRAAEKDRAEAASHDLAPLDERLKKLFGKIPLAAQREGLALASLQASLRGRQRDRESTSMRENWAQP